MTAYQFLVVALSLLIAGGVFALVVALDNRSDRREAARVVALRRRTPYVPVTHPVDEYWRDEHGRPR